MASPTLRRPLVLGSVMAALFMIAIEATIVSTVMPQIAGQLGDLHLYSWVFASFLLAQTAMTVVFGKLADVYGRKPIMLAGIAVFLAGSVLCGFAWSIPSLIVFRLIQGVGAGAIQPVCLTIVGDLYSVQERAKIQGWLASVWGISSVLGPLAGGVIIQHTSWAWVFWLNVPIGILAGAAFIAVLHEDVAPKRQRVDVIGAALFTAAVASLMVALTQLGTADLRTAAVSGAVCIVSTVLFVLQERRADDPMVDFRLWARRPIATANAATLASGMAVIGLTTFLPMYVQGVLGQSALVAGFAVTAMVLGWPIGATVAARSFTRFGLRPTLLLGGALLPLGATAFLFLAPGVSPWVAGLGSVVMGLGMGFLTTAAIVIVQDSVGWAERGAATASNIFSRNLGSTLGATVLGAVWSGSLGHGITSVQVQRLLDQPGPATGDLALRAALGQTLHMTFWAILVIAAVTLLLALLVPKVAISQPKQPALAE
ncbi:MAG: MFS transporter [Gemmatimonadaceae bacterium]|nr:MFS transporter [Acetobacteraceae bacterium]